MRWAVMLCCMLGLGNLIAHPESLLTWGQKVKDPKLGTRFQLAMAFLTSLAASAWATFFPPVELVFAGIVKTGEVEREFKLLPHQGWEFTSAVKVGVKNWDGRWQGSRKGSPGYDRSWSESALRPQKQNNEVSIVWDCWQNRKTELERVLKKTE